MYTLNAIKLPAALLKRMPVLLTLLILGTATAQLPNVEIQEQISGVEVLFIGISPVDESVVWISGTNGTYGRTLDGGEHWEIGVVPGADTLQFRDVHAVNDNTAYLPSIGNGDQFRIYKTTDGGKSWTLQFMNAEPSGFFDCIDFWDAHSGMAFSDSFDGAFYIITTGDGGESWHRVPPEVLPPARPGEGSFAASGHCLHAGGDSTVWIGTGAHESAPARVLKTTDRGITWTYSDTPIPGGSVRGITSVAFLDSATGAVLGGDVADMTSREDNIALTDDGGITWTQAGRPSFSGPVYGAVYVPHAPTSTLVAVGPEGLAITSNQGASWTTLSNENLWTIGFGGPSTGWALGRDGRILKILLSW